MNFPVDIFIDPQKLRKYLLIRKEKNDKSNFLKTAGYTPELWKQLEVDLFELARNNEASFSHASRFGDYYEIKSSLKGPNGKLLAVRTIWMKESFSEKFKFITLIPDKKEIV